MSVHMTAHSSTKTILTILPPVLQTVIIAQILSFGEVKAGRMPEKYVECMMLSNAFVLCR